MSKKKVFNNTAFNLQLIIAEKINQILKDNNINIENLDIKIKAVKNKSKRTTFTSNGDFVELYGDIHLTISSKLNKNQEYNFSDEDDYIMEEDFVDN